MILIHSADIPQPYMQEIDRMLPGLRRITIQRSKSVYESISSHPDIFIFTADYHTVVCAPLLYDEIAASLKRNGVNVIRAQQDPRGSYPDTCSLNAARIGRYIFHNTKYTDPVICDLAREMGLEIVNVNQGYTRCSIVPVGDNAIITCDSAIAKTAEGLGLDAQLLSAGSVALPGERYGFIGGSAGVTPDKKVVFLGDISRHPDHVEIELFLKRHGFEHYHIAGLPLLDSGSLIFLNPA